MQAAVLSAQQQLATDQARLEAEKPGTVGAQQAAAQAALTSALNQQIADQAKLDALRNGTFQAESAADQGAVVGAQLQNALEAAGQKLLADETTLKLLNDGPLPTDIRQAQDQVKQAQAALGQAQTPGAQTDLANQQAVIGRLEASLQGTAQPYTDADLQAAAGVASAQAALQVAEDTLQQTVVTAPFSGVVGAVLKQTGAHVSSSTPILTLSSVAARRTRSTSGSCRIRRTRACCQACWRRSA